MRETNMLQTELSSAESTRVGTVDGSSLRSGSVLRRRRAGFTLLEILIATGILTIGLASIVALFPVAMNTGRKVIEISNAVVVAQSVAEAIRDGVRNRKRYKASRQGVGDVFFVFQHDGVKSKVPSDPAATEKGYAEDYFILLPRYRRGQKFASGRGGSARTRAVLSAKTFVYPETDAENPNGRGDSARADDDSDDDNDDKAWTLKIGDVYRLGNQLLPSGAGSEGMLESLTNDVLKQYSFAFAITPSFFDANLSTNSKTSFTPANSLYHVRVFVYRAYPTPEQLENIEFTPSPVYELDFEIAI